LLVGSDGHEWQKVANELTQTSSLPIKSYRIAADGDLSDPENNWHTIYEITSEGAVLVRPDGHVAWRSQAMSDSLLNSLTELFSYFR
jgi:putative polyketide hydroxylase